MIFGILMKNYFKTGTIFSNGLLGVTQIMQQTPQMKRLAFNYGSFLGLLFQLIGKKFDLNNQ